MSAGAITMVAGNASLLTSCGNTKSSRTTEQLPAFGFVGFGGPWIRENPKESLTRIAEWGYTELEGGGNFGMSPEEAIPFLKSLGFVQLIGSQSMANLIGDESRLKASLERNLNLGQKYVACYWPWVGETRGKEIDEWKEVADNLNRGSAICKSAGIQLIYHNHDIEFFPVEGQIPFDVLVPLLDPAIGIELDVYWITRGGKSAVEYLKKYPGRYPVLHVKDLPADVKCGYKPHVFEELSEKDFACIGDGILDFAEIFRTNSISGAKHFIVENDRPADPAACLESSGKYLRELRF